MNRQARQERQARRDQRRRDAPLGAATRLGKELQALQQAHARLDAAPATPATAGAARRMEQRFRNWRARLAAMQATQHDPRKLPTEPGDPTPGESGRAA